MAVAKHVNLRLMGQLVVLKWFTDLIYSWPDIFGMQDRKALKKCFKNTKVSGCEVANKVKRLPTPAPILALAAIIGLQDPEDLTVNVRAGPAASSGDRRCRDVCDTGITIRVFMADAPEPLLALMTEILEAAIADGSIVPLLLEALGLPATTAAELALCVPFGPFGKLIG